jgi:predicted transcriptional regulator
MSIEGESNRTRGRPKRLGPSVLSPGEFEVMELLWRRGPSSSAEVCARMKASRGLAYTTVMTVLDKLHHKGFLLSNPRGRTAIHQPVVEREEALRRCLAAFLRDYFNDSLADFQAFVAQDYRPDILPTIIAEKPVEEKRKQEIMGKEKRKEAEKPVIESILEIELL